MLDLKNVPNQAISEPAGLHKPGRRLYRQSAQAPNTDFCEGNSVLSIAFHMKPRDILHASGSVVLGPGANGRV